MTRKLTGDVILSRHAINRWRLRVDPRAKVTSICGKLKRRIAAELKNGAEVNSRGALEVEVNPGVWAICYPSFMGGWEVATIIREGWEDMEEGAVNQPVDQQTILQMAVKKWGPVAQTFQAMEELSELQQALCKAYRGRETNIAEEIADVKIMLEQLEIIHGCREQVDMFYVVKLERLHGKLREGVDQV